MIHFFNKLLIIKLVLNKILGQICRGTCWKRLDCYPCHSIQYYLDECRKSYPTTTSFSQGSENCEEPFIFKKKFKEILNN